MGSLKEFMSVKTMMISFMFMITAASVSSSTTNKSIAHHSKVVNDLLRNYDLHVPPLRSKNHTVEVAAGLAMIHMDSLTESGILTATAWMRLVWNDYRLQWHESEYGGINVIRFNPKKVWLPDIELYNAAYPSDYSLSSQYNEGTNVLIYPDGEVLYVPPVTMKVLCHNFTHSVWPQGEQECSIKLGSWTYDGLILNLTLYNNKHHIDLTDMSKSSPWLITHQFGDAYQVKYYDCCPEPYESLVFRFKMKPQYYIKDPKAEFQVLSNLLIVSVMTLLILLLGVGSVVFFIIRMSKIETGSYKMTLLREASNNFS